MLRLYKQANRDLPQLIADFYALNWMLSNKVSGNLANTLKIHYQDVQRALVVYLRRTLAINIATQLIRLNSAIPFQFEDKYDLDKELYPLIKDASLGRGNPEAFIVNNYGYISDWLQRFASEKGNIFSFAKVWIPILDNYIKFVSGDTSVIMIDYFVNVEHNYGKVITQYLPSTNIQEGIKELLDIKQQMSNVRELIDYVSPNLRTIILNYERQSKLYGAGKQLSFYKKADINSPEFKEWFKDSVVTDEDWNPLVQYHATNADVDFDKFNTQSPIEFGAHFGTQEQANHRVSPKYKEQNARIYPVYLNIKNPIRMKDQNSWSFNTVFSYLIWHGVITRDEYWQYWEKHLHEGTDSEVLKGLLLSKGYDGIVYLNRYEAVEGASSTDISTLTDAQFKAKYPEAHDSYIVFHPNQIKSQLGNSGEYDANEPSIIARNLSFYKKADVNSPEFKEWFGNSKVVDKQGNPLRLYHGTDASFTTFDVEKSGTRKYSDWGKGIYFTPSKRSADGYRIDALKKVDPEVNRLYNEWEEKAKQFGTTVMNAAINLGFGSDKYKELGFYEDAWRKRLKEIEKENRGTVISAYVKLQNPLRYIANGTTDPFLVEHAKSRGNDGLLILYGDGSIDEVVAFYPEQVRFDTDNPSIIASLKLAITMDKDKEKEKVLTLDEPLKSKNPDDLLNSMGLKLQHTGKYILDNYTNNTFFLPVVEFDADKQNLGRVAVYFGLPWDETKVQALGEPKVQFDATVGNELRSLGAILSDKLHEDFPMLEDVNLRFGWDIDNKFKLFAVKQKS